MSDFQLWFAQYGLWVSYILMGLGLLAILLFVIYHIVQDPRRGLTSIFGVLAIVVVFLITYAMASETTTIETDAGSTMIRMIGGGIITLYILAVIAVVGIIVGEVWALFK